MVRRLYFLTKLSTYKVNKKLCTLFYKSVMESVLTFCITCWGGNCSVLEKGKLIKLIKKAKNFTTQIDSFDDIYNNHCLKKIEIILKDSQHPLNIYIHPSSHSNRLISLSVKTNRNLNSFLPSAIRMYKENL